MCRAMRGRAARIFSSGNRDRSPVIVKQVSIARPVGALKRIARFIDRLDVDYEEIKHGKSRNIRGGSNEYYVFVEDLGSTRNQQDAGQEPLAGAGARGQGSKVRASGLWRAR